MAAGSEAFRPGVCFRFDDKREIGQYRKLAALFDRYSTKFTLAMTCQNVVNDPEFSAMLREFAANGHEIGDHTASHSTFRIRANNPEEAKAFAREKCVDHHDNITFFLHYELIDTPLNRPFVASLQGNKLRDVPEEFSGLFRKRQEELVCHVATGKVYRVYADKEQFKLKSFWGEDNVRLADEHKSSFLHIHKRAGICSTEESLRFLARVSRDAFRKMRLPLPRFWMQPGGYEPFQQPELIRKIYGEEFGYLGADCYPKAAFLTVGEPESGRAVFSMTPVFHPTPENSDFFTMRRRVASTLAKRCVFINCSHLASRNVPGGFEGLLKRYEELLIFCRDNQIPIRTCSEWAKILYKTSHPASDQITLPPIQHDWDQNNIPDGYDPGKAAVWHDNAFVRTSSGELFRVNNLGGSNSGEKKLTLRAKGTSGDTLILNVQARTWEKTVPAGRIVRKLSRTGEWETVTFAVTLPDDAALVHLRLEAILQGKGIAAAPRF
ncbi:MAG: polysaccharide deacetylase family protein [Victivallaceae bacterium]|nr:polysaccharide deacetylase family protein [Victivallaceae bacterium]